MFQSGVVEVYRQKKQGEEGLERKGRLEGGEEADAGGEWVKGGKEERLVFVSKKELLVVVEEGIKKVEGWSIKGEIGSWDADGEEVYWSYDGEYTLYILQQGFKSIIQCVINWRQLKVESRTLLSLPQQLLPSPPLRDFAYSPTHSLFFLLSPSALHSLTFHPSSPSPALILNPLHSFPIPIPSPLTLTLPSSHSPYIYITSPSSISRYNPLTFQLLIHPTHLFPLSLLVTPTNSLILLSSSHLTYYRHWFARPVTFELLSPISLIFSPTTITYINNHDIIQETITISEDTLKCEATEYHSPGDYVIRVVTTSDCGEDAKEEEGTCLNMRNLEIEVWEAYEIEWLLVEIAGGVIGVIAVGVVAWWMVRRGVLKRKEREYTVLVEEIVGEGKEGDSEVQLSKRDEDTEMKGQ